MPKTMPRAMRTWGDELGLLVRRFWWVILIWIVAGYLTFLPVVNTIWQWSFLAIVGLIVWWFVLTARRMPRADHDKWKRATARGIVATWPEVARRLGLSVRRFDGVRIIAGVGYPAWEGWTCNLPVSLPQGLGREHLESQTGLLAQAFGATQASVSGSQIGALVIRLEYVDALAQPFCLEYGRPWDGRSIVMGRASDGEPWLLRLGPHTLVAGASGSGKASLV